jgi:hypothetical protein
MMAMKLIVKMTMSLHKRRALLPPSYIHTQE